MKLKCLFLLLLLGISFCVHAQKRPVILEKQLEIIRKEPDNGDALKFLCQYYLNKGDYSKTITYAEIMKNVADKTKNPLLQLYSYIYQAQAQMMSGREKIAKKNLNLSLELIRFAFRQFSKYLLPQKRYSRHQIRIRML